MLYEIFRSMLGAWGRAVIDWLQAHPATTAGVLALWLALFFTGKYQLQRLQQRTQELVLENTPILLKQEPGLSAQQLYDLLYPEWRLMLRKTAWFIPHRWELWPVPATPKRAAQRIDFTPEWLHQHLMANEIEVPENG